MAFDLAYVKQHKVAIAGAVVVSLLVLYALYKSSASSGSASVATGDPNADALAASEYQTQTAATAQNNALQASVTGQLNQEQYGLQVATLQAATQENSDAVAAQIADLQSNNQTAVQNATTAASLQLGLDTNDTTVQLQNIAANEQLGIAATNSNTAISLGLQNANVEENQQNVAGFVANTQTNANVQIANVNAGVEKAVIGASGGGGLGGVAGIAGAVIGAFL